jgi:hypothetical protein
VSKNLNKIIASTAIAVILAAVGITAVHHHAPVAHANDCEICNFVNVVNAAVLPVIVFAWILGVLEAAILVLGKGISSENPRVYSSRAPPVILS